MAGTSFSAEEVRTRLGCSVRATGSKVFVVTDLPAKKVGSLWLPVKLTSFYGDLPHLVVVKATVLSVGPKVRGIKEGARVAFPRTYFAKWKELEPDVMVGWIEAANLSGFIAEEDEAAA